MGEPIPTRFGNTEEDLLQMITFPVEKEEMERGRWLRIFHIFSDQQTFDRLVEKAIRGLQISERTIFRISPGEFRPDSVESILRSLLVKQESTSAREEDTVLIVLPDLPSIIQSEKAAFQKTEEAVSAMERAILSLGIGGNLHEVGIKKVVVLIRFDGGKFGKVARCSQLAFTFRF